MTRPLTVQGFKIVFDEIYDFLETFFILKILDILENTTNILVHSHQHRQHIAHLVFCHSTVIIDIIDVKQLPA